MEQKVFEKVRKALMESIDNPYNKEEDKNTPHIDEKRKPVITLRKLNLLKQMRNASREEDAQNTAFVPYLYGPPENQGEEGGMGGDMGLGL